MFTIAAVVLVIDLALTVLAVWVAASVIDHGRWWITLLAAVAVFAPSLEETHAWRGLALWTFLLGVLAVVDFYTGTHVALSWICGLAMLQIGGFIFGLGVKSFLLVHYLRARAKKPKRLILGLAGHAGAGKDAAAAALVAEGWVRVAFADKLKQVAYALNPLVFFRGEIQRLQTVVDTYGWEVAKQEPDVRALLQRLGTDAARTHLGADVWVDAAFNDLPPDVNVVITDVRFPNEVEQVRKAGGSVALVSRPGVGPVNGHVSESALSHLAPDWDVINEGTVEDLHEDMKQLAAELAGRGSARRP